MPRKYFFTRTVGKTDDVLQKIVNAVTLTATSSTFPLVKLERKARGEFYVFLAMDSDALFEIPSNLRRHLRIQRLRFEDWPLTPEEIKTMAAQQDIEIHGFNSLRYRIQSLQDPGDPFAADSDVWRPPPTASPEASVAYERLLYWISARGEGTWAQFRDAARTLGVAEDRQAARSAIRRLILLGDIDRRDDGERWSASPPAFVRLADDPDTVYLAGARVPSSYRDSPRERPSKPTTRGLRDLTPTPPSCKTRTRFALSESQTPASPPSGSRTFCPTRTVGKTA